MSARDTFVVAYTVGKRELLGNPTLARDLYPTRFVRKTPSVRNFLRVLFVVWLFAFAVGAVYGLSESSPEVVAQGR